MRLIDADIAISLIKEEKIEGKTLDIIKALGDGLQAETLNQACDRHIKIINSLPTIKADTIKQGQWIWKDHYLICSECSKENDRTNYCPNCGAKMSNGMQHQLTTNQDKQRIYQPKPDGNFGYQPVNKSTIPPSPPTTGSNVVSPESDTYYNRFCKECLCYSTKMEE